MIVNTQTCPNTLIVNGMHQVHPVGIPCQVILWIQVNYSSTIMTLGVYTASFEEEGEGLVKPCPCAKTAMLYGSLVFMV